MEISKVEILKAYDLTKDYKSFLNEKTIDEIEYSTNFSITMNGNTYLFNNATVYHDGNKKSNYVLITNRIDHGVARSTDGKFNEYYLIKPNNIKNIESGRNLQQSFEKSAEQIFSNLDVRSITHGKILF